MMMGPPRLPSNAKGQDDHGGAPQIVARPPLHSATFAKQVPGRVERVKLYYDHDHRNIRYVLTVLDSIDISQLAYHTAVFLIPAGREAEYMFQADGGLFDVAASAAAARLIAVSLGRQHDFDGQAQVQYEIEYVVQIIARRGTFLPSASRLHDVDDAIPFLGLGGIGERNIIASGASQLSGEYVIEQVQVDDCVVRRLYFINNPFVIQSEVHVNASNDDGSGGAANAVVDPSVVGFDYHETMTAGLVGLTSYDKDGNVTIMRKGLVIGLGGGGLTSFLQYLLPTTLQLTVVELDPEVVRLAQTYFGVKSSLDVRVGDALDLEIADSSELDLEMEQASIAHCNLRFVAPSFDFIAVDVDAKDITVGMSCPPESFVQVEYLQTLAKLLHNGGVLAINVSARNRSLLRDVGRQVKAVFATVLVPAQEQEEPKERDAAINVVVFATHLPFADDLLPAGVVGLRQAFTVAHSPTAAEFYVEKLGKELVELEEWQDDDKDTGKASGKAPAVSKRKSKPKSKKGKRK